MIRADGRVLKQICYTRSCTYHLLLVFLFIQFFIQSIYFLVSHCIITCFALNNNKHTHTRTYIYCSISSAVVVFGKSLVLVSNDEGC